ncbi:MAG: hypothetical protein NPIRA02_02640 [Nitrospirales bacterium]|nr:MAG: hypothetical protein NPIRA02_02640 [Nitrospirales bacterium]
MIRYIFAILSVALSLSVSTPLVHAEPPSVAIFDFDIGTTVSSRLKVTVNKSSSNVNFETTRQTNLLTNKLITKLTTSQEVKVVERAKIEALVTEIELSQSEMTNPEHAIRIGHMLGADYMIFGSISMLDPSIHVKQLPYNAGRTKIMSLTAGASVRLVKTETGQVEAAADLQAEKKVREINPEGSLNEMPQTFQDDVFSELADKLASNIINTLVPIKVATHAGNTIYLARAGLSRGSRFEVVKLGEAITHPDDPTKILGHIEETLAIISVTDGLQGMSKAQIDEWISAERSIPKGSICRPIQEE